MLTDERLAEIRGRAEAASPGKWEGKKGITTAWIVDSKGHALLESYADRLLDDHDQTVADVDFSAHSRTDVPLLLAEIDRLRVERDEFKFAAEGMVAAFDRRPDDEPSNVTTVTQDSAMAVAQSILYGAEQIK